ncbi:hypothetical protein [Sinorhizobium terangae]|uniref:Uncharacterized protein n=1 Tax=Sinorhizobium terangae TaxID=110322 RepID=A0A6N7LDR3_SINTE|nr:hypothetical protein [Sinorhizobium terangae]MBB4186385.1 hypothetical protein [Sinorhizobium terangae]MQX15993.1 hypothetical protein [Sinorhizobium terangae]WFU50980.1 hypothetical protein QA637_20435 [Sinorhizobium terangae]
MKQSIKLPTDVEDREKELLALARLVSYARDSAKTLNVEGVQYCLELALASLLQEVEYMTDKNVLPTVDLMALGSLGRC